MIYIGFVLLPGHSLSIKGRAELYTKLPSKYEEIAIVSADSRNDFASKQNLSDAARERLKQEAAKVGANGILLDGIGDSAVSEASKRFNLKTAVVLPQRHRGTEAQRHRENKIIQ